MKISLRNWNYLFSQQAKLLPCLFSWKHLTSFLPQELHTHVLKEQLRQQRWGPRRMKARNQEVAAAFFFFLALKWQNSHPNVSIQCSPANKQNCGMFLLANSESIIKVFTLIIWDYWIYSSQLAKLLPFLVSVIACIFHNYFVYKLHGLIKYLSPFFSCALR